MFALAKGVMTDCTEKIGKAQSFEYSFTYPAGNGYASPDFGLIVVVVFVWPGLDSLPHRSFLSLMRDRSCNSTRRRAQ
jgi:hypothetical protein